jgi:hypothetical protein
MKKFHLFGVVLMAFAVANFTGCNNRPDRKPKDDGKAAKKSLRDDDHDHGPGPHDGTIIEFGKYHGEFTVDHKSQEATVYILGADAKTAAPIQVEKLLLSIKTPQFQLELKADPQKGDPPGKSSRFVGKHENFGKEQEFEGTVTGMMDGKQINGDFKEKEHKDHKHNKK